MGAVSGLFLIGYGAFRIVEFFSASRIYLYRRVGSTRMGDSLSR